jgi:hypothetical protein
MENELATSGEKSGSLKIISTVDPQFGTTPLNRDEMVFNGPSKQHTLIDNQ